MAKIGTAHVEIKPFINEEALQNVTDLIEQAVARGVAKGLANATPASILLTTTVGSSSNTHPQRFQK